MPDFAPIIFLEPSVRSTIATFLKRNIILSKNKIIFLTIFCILMRDIFGEIAQYLQAKDQYSLIIAYPREDYLQQYEYSEDLIDLLCNAYISQRKIAAEVIKKMYKTKLYCAKVFLWAAENGHLDIVQDMLCSNIYSSHNKDKMDATMENNQAIRHAAANGHLNVVKYLLTLPMVNISALDNYAVNYAAENGHLDVVKFLVSTQKVDITSYDYYAICYASKSGHLDVVKYLTTLPQVDATTSNNFAIRWAAHDGHLEVVKYLATLPKIDASANDNWAIRWAAFNGHLEVVKYLATLPSVQKKGNLPKNIIVFLSKVCII